jgi:hypothetical protein
MPGSPDNGETPTKFLQDLSAALSQQKGVDADLSKILTDHILQDPQKPQSVAAARQAIADLAITRAKASGG